MAPGQVWGVIALAVVAVAFAVAGQFVLAMACAFLIWAVSDRD